MWFRKAKLRQPTGQRLSNIRGQQKKSIEPFLFLYYMRKVWYHQIWIQNNLGFLVLILIYILKPTLKNQYIRGHIYNRIKCIFNKSKKKYLTFLWLTNFISLNSLKALLAWVTFWKGRLSFLIATFCCVTVS